MKRLQKSIGNINDIDGSLEGSLRKVEATKGFTRSPYQEWKYGHLVTKAQKITFYFGWHRLPSSKKEIKIIQIYIYIYIYIYECACACACVCVCVCVRSLTITVCYKIRMAILFPYWIGLLLNQVKNSLTRYLHHRYIYI